MLVSESKQIMLSELKGIYDQRELNSVWMILLQEFTGKSPVRILADPDAELSGAQSASLNEAIIRLKSNEPVQYVLGKTEFFGISLKVKPGVLIPRGETEELVEWIITDQYEQEQENGSIRILDIGCGSGAIGISLAMKIREANVHCVDISETALETTQANWKQLQAEKGIDTPNGSTLACFRFDILEGRSGQNLDAEMKVRYDIIASNPPYVLESQRTAMNRRIVAFEPSEALFVPDENPLVFYEAIAEFASHRLSAQGALYVEINDLLGSDTRELMRDFFPHVELRRDINGKHRMIKAWHGR